MMSRMFVLFTLLLIFPAGIILQMVRVGIFHGEGYRDLWSTQAMDFISIPAERGNIYDQNGALLASNRVNYNVAVDPLLLTGDADREAVISILTSHTTRPASYYRNRIRNAGSRSQYVILERNIPVGAYEELSELQHRGIILEEEYRRVYSFDSLAAHLVGFVNHDMTGKAGIEAQYDDILRGTNGLQQVRKDRHNNIFAFVGAPKKLPKQGYSLHTTIDSNIQAILEEELESGVERHRAKKGIAIIVEPSTGAVKALANYPTYDPNNPAATPPENRRNHAVSDRIEPGSTFKLVTAIAAVEQNVVNFDEKFETPENGVRMIHGQAMRDHNPLGTMAFPEVIAKSSNIATSEIAMRLKPETFFQYARNMGFGTPTQIDLPGDESGRLQRPYEWSRVTQPWMSIGYEVQVTPMQLIQAYASFANGGDLMRPYIVETITDEMGNIVQKREPHKVRKIARSSTIEKLLPVFEQVVSDSGTAGWAEIEGLQIAGKTGTAQKYVDGRYQARYLASFAGFFPSRNPEYAILVIMDEPRTSIYGGFTAGSVFKEVAERISGLGNTINRMKPGTQMAGTDSIRTPLLTGLTPDDAEVILSRVGIPFESHGAGTVISQQTPEPGEFISKNQLVRLVAESSSDPDTPEGYSVIPDLTGLPMRKATRILLDLGLNIEIEGSGTIYTQFPRAGERMQQGKTVSVRGRAISMNTSQAIALNE